jgi:hypothetical protein
MQMCFQMKGERRFEHWGKIRITQKGDWIDEGDQSQLRRTLQVLDETCSS